MNKTIIVVGVGSKLKNDVGIPGLIDEFVNHTIELTQKVFGDIPVLAVPYHNSLKAVTMKDDGTVEITEIN